MVEKSNLKNHYDYWRYENGFQCVYTLQFHCEKLKHALILAR